MGKKIKGERVKSIEQTIVARERNTCQHGVDMGEAEKGGCAICTAISKNLERDNRVYKKPSPVTAAMRNKNRQAREEAKRILRALAEVTGHGVLPSTFNDWDTITYYSLEYVGISHKDIEFLMQVKMDIGAREWYEPSQKQIWWLRDINERVMNG